MPIGDPREHIDQIYITGSRSDGKRTRLLMACSRCSHADLFVDGFTAGAVMRAVNDHIQRTEGAA